MSYKPVYPTVAELATMTAQQVFDRVAVHLLKQGKPATLGAGTCVYRGPGGTACAVGVLIPESEYADCLEGGAVGYLIGMCHDRDRPELGHFLRKHQGVLRDLQQVHDTTEPDEPVSPERIRRDGRDQRGDCVKRLFIYPNFGNPCNFPDYVAHSGQIVDVVHEIPTDQDERLYRVRAADGWEGDAWDSELSTVAA
ncbi:hypothetical protein CAL26_21265 [Bordetella genomosp. 9]|uniref:Uncharacterized protein n=1 Tax=Bordetella genomosp. 9 TaxID=1416803 RepID=A0A261R5P3_9BORD|nr:hypothetical protein [Bordetella genomosp. 9]OZI20087.1 hypothetical protein CAL26_21265 [Bordetella genomosp. 9]